ncbi:MAG: alanyl-tRNA editing protein [Burkholderiales bacterium]
MPLAATQRLYLDDPTLLGVDAVVLAVVEGEVALDRSICFPGGGGQPCDSGTLSATAGHGSSIVSVRADEDDVVWHRLEAPPSGLAAGQRVALSVDPERRRAHARHHTALHVLNTIALQAYGAWITGAQIGADYSRIDFKLEKLSPALCADLTDRVNAVVRGGHRVSAQWMPETEFRDRGDLLRTLEVRPPARDGQVRIVTIEGFDAQACGGTHVRSTDDIGRFFIFKTENKGRINKRLYVRLEALES